MPGAHHPSQQYHCALLRLLPCWIRRCQSDIGHGYVSFLGLGQIHGYLGSCQLQSVMIMFLAQFILQLYLLYAGFCLFIASHFKLLPLHVFNDFSWEVFNCRRQAFHSSTREIGCKLFFPFCRSDTADNFQS